MYRPPPPEWFVTEDGKYIIRLAEIVLVNTQSPNYQLDPLPDGTRQMAWTSIQLSTGNLLTLGNGDGERLVRLLLTEKEAYRAVLK